VRGFQINMMIANRISYLKLGVPLSIGVAEEVQLKKKRLLDLP